MLLELVAVLAERASTGDRGARDPGDAPGQEQHDQDKQGAEDEQRFRERDAEDVG